MKLYSIGALFAVAAGTLMFPQVSPTEGRTWGTTSAAATNPQGSPGATPDVWGGNHVRMEVTPQGAILEFDCAHGNILEAIKANAKGEFTVRGTYTLERGGPVSKANPPADVPATYKGTIDGDTMRLEIVLAEKGKAPAPFILTRGKTARLMKCL